MTVEPKSEAVHAAFVVTLATRLVLILVILALPFDLRISTEEGVEGHSKHIRQGFVNRPTRINPL